MLQNNLTSLNDDPTLPDLLAEDTFVNDFRIDDIPTTLTYSDITEINRKLEHLSLETNTQGLRIEVEKAKRQRLQTSVRQLKNNATLPCPELIALRNDLQQTRDQQNAINYQLDNENARTNTLAFRSFSRIYQILAALIPCATLPYDANPEVQILLQELNKTIHHFGVHYAASYV